MKLRLTYTNNLKIAGLIGCVMTRNMANGFPIFQCVDRTERFAPHIVAENITNGVYSVMSGSSLYVFEVIPEMQSARSSLWEMERGEVN